MGLGEYYFNSAIIVTRQNGLIYPIIGQVLFKIPLQHLCSSLRQHMMFVQIIEQLHPTKAG